MIAYTAWDSLQAIAQQVDADLALPPGQPLELTRRRDQPVSSGVVRRLGARLRSALAVRQAPSAKRA